MIKRFALWLIRLYQAAFANRVSPCRFVPSCSSYTMEAIEVHGVAKGSCLGGWRICRCNPWGGHGLDPVPPRKSNVSDSPVPTASPLRNEDHGSCLT